MTRCRPDAHPSRANLPRGRDAKPGICRDRDAIGQMAQLPAMGSRNVFEVLDVKANLARFTYAMLSFATLAVTLGAGKRWH